MKAVFAAIAAIGVLAASPVGLSAQQATAKKPLAAVTTAPATKGPAPAGATKTPAKPATTRMPDGLLLKRDAQGNWVPDIHAAAAIVYDPLTRRVIWEQNSRDERSIASLTKLMTAVTFVSVEPDLSQRVTVTRADLRNANVTYLQAGDSVSYEDLLHLALIPSDNGAARVLARVATAGGTPAFVARMNQMASDLGLANTHYADPSGLDPGNVSCALDISRIITVAAGDARLGPIMRKAEYDVRTSTRMFTIHSTNHLLGTDVDVRGGKTGFIARAGYCLATLLQMPTGSPVAVVVLGETTSSNRFIEARHLFNWVVSRAQGIIGADPQQ